MWRSRIFYIGCSVGIWFASLIVLFMLPFQQTSGQIQQPAQTISSEQLRQMAEKQQLVVLTQAEFAKQQAQINQLKAQLKAEQQSFANKQTKANAKTGNQVYVAIQPGLTLSEIADLLNKAGVVDSADSFVQSANQVRSFIKAGVYELPLHTDNATVLNVITK